MNVTLYQMASEVGAHGMPTPEAMERQGWVRCNRHPRYPKTWTMKKHSNIGETTGLYGIKPLEVISDEFVWCHADIASAKNEAKRLAELHRIEVSVFKILGSFKPSVEWEPV